MTKYGYMMNEPIYRFDSAEEAIQFLHFHILDKRTEVMLETIITSLQRENRLLKERMDTLEFVSKLPDVLD